MVPLTMTDLLRAFPAYLRHYLFSSNWTERLQAWITVSLQLALVGLCAGALWGGNGLVAFGAAAVLLLTFLPAVVEREFALRLPVEFTFVNTLFLYAAFGLGEVQEFYRRFWWWDLMLHAISAVVLGWIGFLIVYVVYHGRRLRIPPFYVAASSFGFAVTLGVLWEIFEYLMDHFFGFNMQKSGLDDTMTDLMVDAGGALLAAWGGYHYVKNGDSLIAERLIRRFVNANPRLFRQRRRRPRRR